MKRKKKKLNLYKYRIFNYISFFLYSFAELDKVTKNSISHRGKALDALKAYFKEKK